MRNIEADVAIPSEEKLANLRVKAKEIRRDDLIAIHRAGSGHPGGSLSMVEILVSLFYGKLRHDPKNPQWPDRDRLVLSKGHGCPGLYTVLAHRGYFPKEQLWTLRKLDSPLQGHPHRGLPGIEASSGSLGQGFAIANGMALAGKLDRASYRVYAILGDGECQEGAVWETAMSAAHYKLDNFCAIVDANGVQQNGPVRQLMGIEPLPEKWRSFGWHAMEANGHRLKELFQALDEAEATKGRPTVIVARTVKGKGVSFMEGKPEWHGKAPNAEQLEQALKEIETRQIDG